MNPSSFNQDTPATFPFTFASFGNNPFPKGTPSVSNMMGIDFIEHQNAVGRAQANIQANMQANANIDSLLHIHRRKLQRRAANRKSAQLSRARKKAHLEELKVENVRLQQLVDVLDSQPELVFCVTAHGDITYISERTVNFIGVNGADVENDEDPTHIRQILAVESVETVLKTIEEIIRICPPKSPLAESSMLFSAKEVKFQDAFGNPLVGSLHCARVNRRPAIDDTIDDDNSSVGGAPPAPLPPAKKAKLTKAQQALATQAAAQAEAAALAASNHRAMQQQQLQQQQHQQQQDSARANGGGGGGGGGGPSSVQVSNLGLDEWNLTNFRILADCVSNLADDHDKRRRLESSSQYADVDVRALAFQQQQEHFQRMLTASSATTTTTTTNDQNISKTTTNLPHVNIAGSSSSGSTSSAPHDLPPHGLTPVKSAAAPDNNNISGSSPDEADSEFVCVIRTSDSYFARYSTRSDLFMFVSTPLSTASMEAHDLKPGNGIARHASLGTTNQPVQRENRERERERESTTSAAAKKAAPSGEGGGGGNKHEKRKRNKGSSSNGGGGEGSERGSSKSSLSRSRSRSGEGSQSGSGTNSGNESSGALPKSEQSSTSAGLDRRDNTSEETGSDDNTGESNSV